MIGMSGNWRKSSFSGSNNCVEFRRTEFGIQVRDSKDPSGPVLDFNRAEWNAFLCGVTNGEFAIDEPIAFS